MKLYTTAAILTKLGPAYKYRTLIATNGSITDSSLNGDLIIKGFGDPSISGRLHEGDILADFRSWADSLKEHGVCRISGSLIGDNSFFTNDILAEGWNWDDEPFWYSAQPSALSFNDNCVDLTVQPAKVVGQPVQISVSPDIGYLNIINQATTSGIDSTDNLNFSRKRAQNVAVVSGTLPINMESQTESISVEQPGLYFLTMLRNVLEQEGIQVNGETVLRNVAVTLSDTLFIHYSHPLSELIRITNKISHNFYAEQFLKTLGAVYAGEGSFPAGAGVVAEWLHSIGVAPNEFLSVDGSGLSRKNYISPLATITLLRWMYQQGHFPEYYESLPIAGVDGTIKRQMKHTAAQGNVHAKTGTMSHVRSLAGYVHDTNNHLYIFSIMANNYTVPTAYIKSLQDKICVLLSNNR
jgi:D-alanyl-D-alanine carboxypeptidase/D-alanyl-D-alanine-endopeptidase (penicillin-binding protein 4)